MGMIECRECKAQISDTAVSCPRCGYVGKQSSSLKPTALVTSIVAAVVGSCGLISLIPSKGVDSKPAQVVATQMSSAAASPVVPLPPKNISAEQLLTEIKSAVADLNPGYARERNAMMQHWFSGTEQSIASAAIMAGYEDRLEIQAAKDEANRSEWSYSTSTDQMTGKETKFATLSSDQTFELDFPYAGQQRATLTLRKHPRSGLNVMVRIERGQLLCSSYSGCSLQVRFDSGALQTFSAVGPDDNSSETIFVSNASRFLASLKKSRSVKIILPIYQNGGIVHSFRTVALNW